ARVEGYRPVRPRYEGVRWAWLRAGRTPSPPIAVVTRRLDLDLGSPLLAGSPDHARTIVITTEAAPPARRGQVAATADVIVGGRARRGFRARGPRAGRPRAPAYPPRGRPVPAGPDHRGGPA